MWAAWYNVPKSSLAFRRAARGELTAAHNSLPLGALVRVTSLSNGKSVILRITDRGVPRGRAKLDVCKEAAQQLGMIQDGTVRVRVELLASDKIAAPSGSPPANANP